MIFDLWTTPGNTCMSLAIQNDLSLDVHLPQMARTNFVRGNYSKGELFEDIMYVENLHSFARLRHRKHLWKHKKILSWVKGIQFVHRAPDPFTRSMHASLCFRSLHDMLPTLAPVIQFELARILAKPEKGASQGGIFRRLINRISHHWTLRMNATRTPFVAVVVLNYTLPQRTDGM